MAVNPRGGERSAPQERANGRAELRVALGEDVGGPGDHAAAGVEDERRAHLALDPAIAEKGRIGWPIVGAEPDQRRRWLYCCINGRIGGHVARGSARSRRTEGR